MNSVETSFGSYLKELRRREGLSQEALAERARMSAAAISALERGSRQAPYRSSVDLLADALNLAEDERLRLHELAGARRRARALPSVREETPIAAPLPSWLNRMVARETELASLISLVRERRLVTVTGSGGSGKTRLSVAAAHSLSLEFANSIYYVDLTKASLAAHVPGLLANALGLTPDRNVETVDVLQSWLKSKRVLIVLDNCEHVVSSVSELATRVLFECGSVHFLATSRQPLHVAGEAVFVLPPLARDDAIRLFIERANDAGESLASATTGVGELCDALDDLPLAIELAAAQIRHLSVQQIIATISKNSDALRSVTEAHPRRHRTINATIRWSYELLGDEQKRLFRILAIFPGTWPLDALPYFAGGPDASETLETHASMIDRCFVRVAHTLPQRRYGYLQTIRAFAMGALRTSDDYTAAVSGLSSFALDVARRCSAGIGTSAEPECLAVLDAEYAAIEAALRSSSDNELGHELVRHLCEYWIIRADFASGVELASEVLRGPRDGVAGDVIDATELAFARLMRTSGRVAEAYVADSIVLERARARGDAYLAARALGNIASDEFDIGKAEPALELYREAAAALRPFGNSPHLVRTLHGGGIAAAVLQRYDESESLLNEAERVALKIGDRRGLAWIAYRRGYLANGREQPRESERQYEESFRLFRDIEDRPGIAFCYEAIGTLRIEKQQYAEAARVFLEGIDFSRRLGLVLSMVSMVERVAHIAFVQGKINQALSLFACASERRAEFSRPIEAPTAHDMRDLIELAGRSPQMRSNCATLDDLFEEASNVVRLLAS